MSAPADTAVTTLLVHSPFLGPASLRPLADALAAHGHPAVLLDLRPSVVAPPVHQRLIGAFDDAIGDAQLTGPVVMAGHSAAGPLLPAFADALDDLEIAVSALVFVDAGLPTPGRSWRETVSAERYRQMRELAHEGQLPRWPQWWSAAELAGLVPDEELRAEIVDEAPEVPLAFLKETRPGVEWPGPAGYVELSAEFAPDATEAEALGWPVRRLSLNHLAPATAPDPVAIALLEVSNELLIPRP